MSKIAVLIPCYNEEAVLHETTKQLSQLVDDLIAKGKIQSCEIIYVDDMWGSETPANRRASDDVILHHPPEFMTTESNWQSLNTANGECGKFVYNENNNTVRIPNVKIFRDNYSLGEYKYVVVSQLL